MVLHRHLLATSNQESKPLELDHCSASSATCTITAQDSVLEGDCSPTDREAGIGQIIQFIISTMDVKLFSCVKFHTLNVN